MLFIIIINMDIGRKQVSSGYTEAAASGNAGFSCSITPVIETPIAATSSSSGSSTPIRRLSGHIAAVATYPPHSQTTYPAFFSAR